MRVRCRNEWLAEALRNFDRAPVRIEKAAPEMAELDRVEMIDVLEESLADRTAENVKRMGRDREERRSAPTSQPDEIIEGAERGYIVRPYIQQNHVRAFEADLGRGDQKNAHARRVRENFRAVENRIVERDSENAKAKRTRPFKELMRGIIQRVLRIVEGVDVEICLDPFFVSHAGEKLHLNPLSSILSRSLAFPRS